MGSIQARLAVTFVQFFAFGRARLSALKFRVQTFPLLEAPAIIQVTDRVVKAVAEGEDTTRYRIFMTT